MKIHSDLSIRELLSIKDDPNYRIGSTKMGQEPGKSQMYIGKAVPWKGRSFLTGGKGSPMKSAETLAQETGISVPKAQKLLDNMEKLRTHSKTVSRIAGKGAGYVAIDGGEERYYTFHQAALMRAAGRKVGSFRQTKTPVARSMAKFEAGIEELARPEITA